VIAVHRGALIGLVCVSESVPVRERCLCLCGYICVSVQLNRFGSFRAPQMRHSAHRGQQTLCRRGRRHVAPTPASCAEGPGRVGPGSPASQPITKDSLNNCV
jgi:hypothetical protein